MLDVMRATWALDLAACEHKMPVFPAIAAARGEDIARCRLKPGESLPGTRTLAAALGVHRNTVIAAYRELEAQGFTETSPAKDTRVRGELPARARRQARARPDQLGFDLARLPVDASPSPEPTAGAIALYGGMPDLAAVPNRELARAYRRALLGRRAPLGYGDPAGEGPLREALASLLARSRGFSPRAEDLLITRGSQLALYLTARVLLRPGDRVAVEAFGYRPAWSALQATGAELVPIPVDAEGIDVDALARRADEAPLRAVYVTPHHQYPTTALMSQARRLRLLELARAHRFATLEDDYDHEFHYESKPVLPLASRDESGVVVYLGTLSKILAPGLRIGFVSAPAALISELGRYRTIVDRQGSRAEELAVAELIEEGVLERHARKMRRAYHARRDALVDALERRLGDRLAYRVPNGGMALWARAEGVDVDAWASRAECEGVLVQTARRFTFDRRPRPFLRLGFAAHPEARLRAAVERLARALDASRSPA